MISAIALSAESATSNAASSVAAFGKNRFMSREPMYATRKVLNRSKQREQRQISNLKSEISDPKGPLLPASPSQQQSQAAQAEQRECRWFGDRRKRIAEPDLVAKIRDIKCIDSGVDLVARGVAELSKDVIRC